MNPLCRFCLLALAVLASSFAAAPARADEGKLTGLLFYAADTEPAEPPAIEGTETEAARYATALAQAAKARHYRLIGKHTAPIQSHYSIWLKPSPQFPLQIENTGATPDGGLSLYWILWQKEQQPTKDRELVKSTTVLTGKTPLVITGPRWRGGRLIFVVRKEN